MVSRLAVSNLRMVVTGCLLVLLWGCAVVGPVEEDTDTRIGLPVSGDPLVTIRIVFRTGSVNDPDGKNGLNALTALMLGRGGTETLSYQELTTVLYPWAASIGVQSDKEVTTVVGQVHRDHLEEFYIILRSLVIAPGFDRADFERNKEFLTNTVVSSLRGTNDEELGKETLNGMLYQGHPYAAPTVGTERGLAAITLDDVREFYVDRYTHDKFQVGVAGGYPNGFLGRIEADLISGLGGGAEPKEQMVLPLPRTLDGLEVTLVEKDTIATAISIGFPIDVNRADDDFYALLVANSYFGEHRNFNGLLMNRMRGDRGLNYGDYSYIENFIQDGGSRFPIANIPRTQQFFSIWIRPVPHHNAHFALRQALRELERLVTDGLSQADFESTREFLLNYSKLYVQTASRRLGYLMDSRFYGTGYFIDEIQQRLPQLTVDDVNAAVRRHLQSDDLAIAIVTSGAESLRDRLLANEPSPATYNMEVTDEIVTEDEAIMHYELAINANRVQLTPVEQMFRAVN